MPAKDTGTEMGLVTGSQPVAEPEAVTRLKSELRDLVIAALVDQGFDYRAGRIVAPVKIPEAVQRQDKDSLKQLHDASRLSELTQHRDFLLSHWGLLGRYLADGNEVDPERIKPRLVPADTGEMSDVFRLFRLVHWSLPYSKGYGRRLRYVLIDEQNGKLMGLLGFQSPPVSIKARDALFQYPQGRKIEMINQSMDIYALGSVPPYSNLLGGKLMAYAAACNEIRSDYAARYRDQVTLIERRQIPSRLVFLTTTSAYGRSSQYQRLKYQDRQVATSIGYTSGSGTFHFPTPVYNKVKQLLSELGMDTGTGYGEGWQKGPRRRLQQISRALKAIGLDRELVYHGVPREVFLYPLVSNLGEFLSGDEDQPHFYDYPFDDLSRWWQHRWCVPRSDRDAAWRSFTTGMYVDEAHHLLVRAGLFQT